MVPQPTSPRDRVGGSQISRHPRNFGAPFCAWNFLVLWEPIRGIWEPRNRPARGSQISRHPRNFGDICVAGRSLAAMRKKVEGIKALRGISGPLDPWWSICNQNSLRTGAAQNFGTIWCNHLKYILEVIAQPVSSARVVSISGKRRRN